MKTTAKLYKVVYNSYVEYHEVLQFMILRKSYGKSREHEIIIY